MKIFIVCMCIIMTLIGWMRTKNILNPISIFCGIWAILFFLSSLGLYGLNTAKDSTYILLFLGVAAYFLGSMVAILTKTKHIRLTFGGRGKKVTSTWKLNYGLLHVLGLITLLYYLLMLPSALRVLLSGSGLDVIRYMAQNTEAATSAGGKIVNAFRVLVFIPTSMSLIPITTIDIWFGKRDKKLLFLCISIILLRVISEGGRILIVYFGLHLLVGFMFLLKYGYKNAIACRIKQVLHKGKKYIKYGMAIVLILLIVTTVSRAGSNMRKILYYYFSMQPYMFETWANRVDSAGVVGFGIGSLNGLFFAIFYLIKNILGLPFPGHFNDVYQMILLTDSEWQIITDATNRANAYISTFWYFYLDGREIGVVVLSFLYGYIAGALFQQAKRNIDQRSVTIYSFYLQSIVLTFSGLSFASVYYCLAFLFICSIAFRRRREDLT